MFAKTFALCLMAASMLSSTVVYAQAADQDTVVSQTGKIVVSTGGKCVRSQWMAADDECAPDPEPVPVAEPVPPPPPVPSQEQRTVYFDFNKSTLNPSAMDKLDSLASWVKDSKTVSRAMIVGYADQIGSSSYNATLSENRAKTVEQYLLGKGVTIPTSVSVLKGMGEAGSVTACADNLPREEKIACLARDRRVEVQFETLR